MFQKKNTSFDHSLTLIRWHQVFGILPGPQVIHNIVIYSVPTQCSMAFTQKGENKTTYHDTFIQPVDISLTCLTHWGRDKMAAIFPDYIFKYIFSNENVRIFIKISLTFVPKDPINNIEALVQRMAWCLVGAKQLSEPMMIRLPTHICITWSQWVQSIIPTHIST